MQPAKYVMIAAAGICTLGSAAAAQSPASQSFRIQLRIPEYCEISTTPIFVGQGSGQVAGAVFESCNIQEGFQVVASHRELLDGETVGVTYAGKWTQLSKFGESQVANRVGAKFGSRPIAVQYSGIEAPLAINLTITYF